MRHSVLAVIGVCLPIASGAGQCTPGTIGGGDLTRPVAVGTAADDSLRMLTLTPGCQGNPSLLRSSISLTTPVAPPRWMFEVIDPEFHSTWNSRIPVSFNDGAMWAGRGMNVEATAGVQAAYRQLRVILSPALASSENLPFEIIPNVDPGMNPFASPWHTLPYRTDLPLRFGDQPYTRIDPGESTIDLTVRGVGIGVSSSSQWWGPGIFNALVMSNNAAGIPRGYLRTASPLRTPVGDVEAQWMLGGLSESPFFDSDPRNNLRSVSGAAITLRLAADSEVTIGAGRVVFSYVRRFGRLPEHVADVFFDWHRPGSAEPMGTGSDQLTALFARWVVPEAGLEFHFEWAKPRMPASFRELLVDPQRYQGYTVGAEWAKPVGTSTTIRSQLEFTDLDQTPLTVGGFTPEFYTSHAVAQGYTQEGQSVGAAIGPSSSSEILQTTVYHDRWQLGGNVGRIRWEDGAYYRDLSEGRFGFRDHDVSLFAGLTARGDWAWTQASLALTRTVRWNYLFQTPNAFFPQIRAFDVPNWTLSFNLTPHVKRLRR